jgi:hypothetical protein
MHGPMNVKFSIGFIISECSINSAFERAITVMRAISRGLLLENFAGIGRRGCAEQPGLQFPCLSNSVGRSTAEVTDVIHNAQSLTIYKSQGFYNWRSVSLCVFLPSPFMGPWPYIFLSEWLSWGVSLDKKMGPVVYQVSNLCKYLTKTYKLIWYWRE